MSMGADATCHFSLHLDSGGAVRQRLLLIWGGVASLVLIGCPVERSEKRRHEAGDVPVGLCYSSALGRESKEAQTMLPRSSPQSSPSRRPRVLGYRDIALYSSPFKSSRLSGPGPSSARTSPNQPGSIVLTGSAKPAPWPSPSPCLRTEQHSTLCSA